jgi:pimeloyl-ACP methyl ester carboxylesterase
MEIVDVGSGVPLVLVPGIQGRWEWMKPAVDALARRCRVITFSLADEPTCGGTFDSRTGFDCYVEQIGEAMDLAGVGEAAICGVSYGGLIAATFAARHRERVSSLVLVSAIPPTWRPDARVRFYLRAPRLMMPLFMIGSLRMYREIAAAIPGRLAAAGAALRHAVNVLTHMFSPVRMARRADLLPSTRPGADAERRFEAEIRSLDVPTLIVTGEPELDRVVPVSLTQEYARWWPHAQQTTLANTGHIGLITRPEEFARMVTQFIDPAEAGHHERDRASQDQVRRRIV